MTRSQIVKRTIENMKKHILQFGQISIQTPTRKITGIKSVSNWGAGIYYSKRKNAQSFSKSLCIEDVLSFSGLG